MLGGVGLKRKKNLTCLAHTQTHIYVCIHKHTLPLIAPLRQEGSPESVRDVRGLAPCIPAVNTLPCGLWVLSLGLSQRNTSPVVSMATSLFPWNGKVCDGLEPEWAFWLHVCEMRGFREEKALGTLT